jgi:hypothetical protein
MTIQFCQKYLSVLDVRRARFLLIVVGLFSIKVLSNYNSNFTEGPTVCPFRLVTGFPCPGCGTTRAVAAFLDGRLSDSIEFNPLGVTFLAAALLWGAKFDILERFIKYLNRSFEKLTQKQRTLVGLALLIFILTLNVFRVQKSSLI